MPIKHAAVKQLRKDRTRAQRNVAVSSALKTLQKRVRVLLAQQQRDEVVRLLPAVMRQFDRAAAKGVIHKNVASRTKSRLMRRVRQLSEVKAGTTAQARLPAPLGEASARS